MYNRNLKYFIATLNIIALVFYFAIPNISQADDFYGVVCGDKTCGGDQTCQKTYRGVLPIEEPNPTIGSFLESVADAVIGGGGSTGVSIEPTWSCVSPKRLEAPEGNRYKGRQISVRCSEDSITGGVLGGLTGGILNGALSGGLNGALNGLTSGVAGQISSGLNGITGGISDLVSGALAGTYVVDDLNADCVYNDINQRIDSRNLKSPLPVDIFNPLPLPVNVTSPNPLPVVVVDDLALYQQKELIDAPLAAQQKAKTIGIISDDLRAQISEDNLIPNNYFAPTALGIQFGALDEETGVVVKDSIDTYGDYVNYDLATIDVLTQWYEDRQEQESKLPTETLTPLCGNITVAEAGQKSLFCGMTAILTNNNPNDLYDTVWRYADEKNAQAAEFTDNALRDGRGYFPTTEYNKKNPFINQITTPGSSNQELAAKVMESTIDQAIDGSGDNCYEALPQNILEGSLKPVLQEGLYGVSNTLSSVIGGGSGDGGGGGGGEGIADLFSALGDSLLANLTQGLSCEMTNSLSGLLGGLIDAILN